MTFKAIPSSYRGILFRSRLEIRWARFFDAIGVRWEYEPEGYTDGTTSYLPDFWLPDVHSRAGDKGLYFEVKPCRPTQDELTKAVMLACGTKKPVIIVERSPGVSDHWESLIEVVWNDNGFHDDYGLLFAMCSDCGAVDIGFYSGYEPECSCGIGFFTPFDDRVEIARDAFPSFSRWEAKA